MSEEKKPEVNTASRKKTLVPSIQGAQKGNIWPDINAGVCEHCGVPTMKCEACGTTILTYLDKEGALVVPTHCRNRKCGVALKPEWYDALAYCAHYADVRNDIRCIYCKSRESVMNRKMKVRGIPQPDGSDQLVLVCSDFSCRRKFEKQFLPNKD